MTDEDILTVSDGAGLWGARLFSLSTVDSTNTWACRNVQTLQDGDVVITRSQTAGRGRFERSWLSGSEGIALSAVIRRMQDAAKMSIASRVAAVAVAECLEDFSFDVRLKWPNDVIVGGRKIAGLLSELADNASVLVLGIGLNVNVAEAEFEAVDLLATATSMAIEKGKSFDSGEVGAWLLSELETAMDRYLAEGDAFLSSEWARRDWLTGRKISVHCPDRTVSGAYAGVNAEGQLLIESGSGVLEAFWSGDVTVDSI